MLCYFAHLSITHLSLSTDFPASLVQNLNSVCLKRTCGTWLLAKRRTVPLPKVPMRPQITDFRDHLVLLFENKGVTGLLI